jgi:hypothetical protein
MRPNHICNSAESSQLAVALPTAGPKYRAAQIASNSAVIEIASLIKPRTKPTITDMTMATAMSMSMIGIRDVGAIQALFGEELTQILTEQ